MHEKISIIYAYVGCLVVGFAMENLNLYSCVASVKLKNKNKLVKLFGCLSADKNEMSKGDGSRE